MLIIPVKQGERIDNALKRYRKKHRAVKLLREIRSRKMYKKESVRRREELKKAQYKERLYSESQK